MKKLVDFYKIHFRKKLFNKIVFIYSIITVMSLASLSGFVYMYQLKVQATKELEFNNRILSNISKYLDMRYATSQQIVQQIYRDESGTLLEDVYSFLRSDFAEYLDDRLEKYGETGVRRRDIMSYLRLQLNNYPDIRMVALYSENQKFILLLTRDTQNYYYVNGDLQSALKQYVISDKSFTTVSNINSLTQQESIGNLIIDYDLSGMYGEYVTDWGGLKGYVAVVTPGGEVLFDSSSRYYGQKYPYLSRLSSSSDVQNFEEPSYTNVQVSNRFGYYVIGVIPKAEIAKSLRGLRNTLFLVTGICIVGAMVLARFTIVNFSRRTRSIMKALEKARNGDLSVRIPVEKEDELYEISDRFNQMCADLTKYIDRVYVSEIKQKQAELVAFQAQIKPHFLYNTLEAIRMRALSKKADDVGEMIYILSTLFRYSVKSDTVVTLADELEYCSLYLDLFRIRYVNNFAYEIDAEPELMNMPVLKLSIQPLIENYIVHGLVMSRSDNRISIQAELREGDLVITLQDNGRGIPPEKREEIRRRLQGAPAEPSASIGLINTHERIKICFGDRYGLELSEENRQGTVITMKLPSRVQGGRLYA
ncbi:two-component sensor histidine kinase [Paenibacillus albilobatus]|uniref:Two-component sensor histidine kinase n=1 Tax=Paenibacillus albilobatus TaxID=2716884 RepID=A0A919XCV2_9BACL|nr:sensor histidine kinase [Paenibacillus albilobatus]GIO30351.1 two-component sensor histidine kinase [Paenibacillus albilobatus]